MRTSNPISTISYNTDPFLTGVLNELLQAHKIEFWAYINHKPEDDEAGNKPHKHVYIVPAHILQTEAIKDSFNEIDLKNPGKPLKCMSFRRSKTFDDWYLYVLHNTEYLLLKGQTRRYHYEHSEMITSDEDELLCYARQVDLLSNSPYSRIVQAVKDGLSWDDFFRQGNVPIPQIRQFREAFYTVSQNRTFRNGRVTHTPQELNKMKELESKLSDLKIKHYDMMIKGEACDIDELIAIETKIKNLEERLQYMQSLPARYDANDKRVRDIAT